MICAFAAAWRAWSGLRRDAASAMGAAVRARAHAGGPKLTSMDIIFTVNEPRQGGLAHSVVRCALVPSSQFPFTHWTL